MASLGVQARGARRSGMTAFPSPPVSGAQRLRPVFHILLTLLAMVAIAVRPAMAQSILRDAETEALFPAMMDPLTVAAGPTPGPVRVHLLRARNSHDIAERKSDRQRLSGGRTSDLGVGTDIKKKN